MQDRFKFRAWDKRHKEYAYDVQNEFQKYGHMICETLDFGQALNDDELELEQCTGLKDKNGKLIYEGDIVDDGEQYAKIIFDKSCFCYDNGSGFYDDLDFYYTHCEVIGNIHENPELLEEDK